MVIEQRGVKNRICVICGFILKKFQADGSRDLFNVSGRGEAASARVDGKDYDVVGALIRDQEERTRRIDREIARPLASRRDVLDEGELTRTWIDLKDDDTVVATIRAVQELTRF